MSYFWFSSFIVDGGTIAQKCAKEKVHIIEKYARGIE